MTRHSKLGLIIPMVALLAIMMGGFASAECICLTLPILDSADFPYKYEMTVDPGTQNLDTDPAMDWLRYDTNGVQTLSGGVLTSGYDLAGYPLLRSSYFEADGVWTEPLNNINYTDGWTVEVSMRVTMADADPAACSIQAAPVGCTDRAWLSLTPTDTSWVTGTAEDGYEKTSLDTKSNSDGFHIFRIAQEADSDNLCVWRDGELLPPCEETQLTYDAPYGVKESLYIGDITGGAGSEYKIDYVRVTSGAYAPIPEPTTLMLLVCGALMVLVRCRVR